VKDALGTTLDASTPSCSAMMAFTLATMSAFIETHTLDEATRLIDARELIAGAEKALA
jgi:hypothetical protein